MKAYLGVKDVQSIAARIQARQVRFGEDFVTSVGVVLLNYGDSYVRVECVAGEWSGAKGDLQPREGVPLCPNGHPLFEVSLAPRLAVVDAEGLS